MEKWEVGEGWYYWISISIINLTYT